MRVGFQRKGLALRFGTEVEIFYVTVGRALIRYILIPGNLYKLLKLRSNPLLLFHAIFQNLEHFYFISLAFLEVFFNQAHNPRIRLDLVHTVVIWRIGRQGLI